MAWWNGQNALGEHRRGSFGQPPLPRSVNTASIAGKALDENGAAVQAALTAVSGRFVYHAITGGGGKFFFRSLPAGNYVLCGSAAPPIPTFNSKIIPQPFVDSCVWMDNSYPKIALAAGQAYNGAVVTIKHGVRVTVRVNDPTKLLPPAAGVHSGNELSVRLAGPSGIVHRIPIASQDSGGRTHAITVPYNVSHSISISSTQFDAKDNQGSDQSAASPRLFQVVPGGQPPQFVVNITPKGAK